VYKRQGAKQMEPRGQPEKISFGCRSGGCNSTSNRGNCSLHPSGSMSCRSTSILGSSCTCVPSPFGWTSLFGYTPLLQKPRQFRPNRSFIFRCMDALFPLVDSGRGNIQCISDGCISPSFVLQCSKQIENLHHSSDYISSRITKQFSPFRTKLY
jgi:hypothetical protein